MLDLTDSIAPKSDQMNSDDLMSGPRTFTIAEVRKGGSAEQPYDYVLAEFPKGRPFKPSKTVRRILVMLWGKDASAHVGRRFTLYRDPNVRFGGQQVGGIRVSAMSHIDGPQKLSLTETRGKKATHVIEPLTDDAPTATPVDEETVARLADLRAEWKDADDDRKKVIEAEVKKLQDGGQS